LFSIGLAAVFLLGLSVSARAVAANVVPNAGFEDTACLGPSNVCDWALGSDPSAFMSLDTVNVHSGSESLFLGWAGETGGSFGLPSVGVETVPSSCATIGPGGHQASFWYANASGGVAMDASFYQGPDCTGAVSYSALNDWPSGDAWRQVTGVLVAPAGTQSALFSLSDGPAWCDNYSGCSFAANFDDVVVDDRAVTTPAITSFTPSRAPAGTSVDILGVNFTGASSVTFGGTAADFTVDSDSEIHATVPHGALAGPISVTTPTGTAASNEAFGVAPTISSFSPTCGSPGTSVDIRGSEFAGAVEVRIGASDASFTVDSDSEIHAIVPNAPAVGSISVSTGSAIGSSSGLFGGACDSQAPSIDSFAPTSGAVGMSVDIHGTNLTGANLVTFGGVAATFVVNSDTEIQATVPAGAGSGPISVWTPHGPTASLSSFAVITDTTPPDTTIISGPPANTTSSSATFQFTASEPATFECSLDAVAFSTCSSPVIYTGLVVGLHTFRVRATDTAGNTDPTPAQQSWTMAPNTPPAARFTFSCTGLTCHLDGSGSADSDGTITGYVWDFGDGTSASTSGVKPDHTYTHAGGYTVTLTITDNGGATGTTSTIVTPISVAGRGYKVNGLEKVDLAWNGPSGTNFNVFRNGTKIATVQTTAYTDNLNNKGSGTYTYKVCALAFASCSDPVTVRFSAGAVTSRAARLARDSRVHRGRTHHTPVRLTHRGKRR
jgi:PKD repeat protein